MRCYLQAVTACTGGYTRTRESCSTGTSKILVDPFVYVLSSPLGVCVPPLGVAAACTPLPCSPSSPGNQPSMPSLPYTAFLQLTLRRILEMVIKLMD